LEHCRFRLDAARVDGIFTVPDIVATVNPPGKIRGSRPFTGQAIDGTSILFEADAAISYNIKFI